MSNFHQTKVDSDDPRLTAYALGELEGEERTQLAAAVAADPALQAIVEEIRDTAARLTAALEAEPMPAPTLPLRVEPYRTVRPARIFRFPYWGIAAAAVAASLAVVIAVRELPLASHDARKAVAEIAGQATPTQPAARAGTTAAGAPQPSNHVDIQFPKLAENASPASPADQWGAVVPNPPPAARVALPSPDRAAVAGPADRAAARIPAPPQAPDHYAGLTDEEVKMAPFAVTANESASYSASTTLAGSRVRTELSDLGSTVTGVATQRARVADATGNFAPGAALARGGQPFNTEAYDHIADNDFLGAALNPRSTFAVDVDTASYANVRRFLLDDQRPPRDAVRIEELVNYFAYDYAGPKAADPAPFAASLEVASAPWAPTHRLVRIGLKGRELSTADRPAANLVFLVDVSGSMDEPNKLPLVKESLRLLVAKLKPEDRVAIAVYAGSSGLALPSTSVSRRQEILDAIDGLSAGGSTNGAMGIQLAYDIARANFIQGGINRVILATDGDFNVGVTSRGDLVRLIEEKARSGVFLTALGFGMGNYKDATLEQLADRGNGAYAYIDSAREARRVLAEQVGGTLAVIAKDVKVQVEFNPAQVQAYRLIGYENRLLKAEDFNNDRIDAGEIGAGHTVTALYEVIPAGAAWTPESSVDPLKYQRPANSEPQTPNSKPSDDLLTVKIRYQAPDGHVSRLLEFPLVDRGTAFADASLDFKFAAAVAGFGLVLRDSPHKGAATLAAVEQWANQGIGSDAGGYRAEFLSLVKRAEAILPAQG
jgi:Ca-activated chloride channel homolog